MNQEFKIQDNKVVQVTLTENFTTITSQELRDQNANFEQKIAQNNILIAQIEALESELVEEPVVEEHPPILPPEEQPQPEV